MTGKNKSELVKQIEAYGLKGKLADLALKEQSKRPFHHLPKQFSKGILIGNIAIVPKKYTGTRYVYVIADMLDDKDSGIRAMASWAIIRFYGEKYAPSLSV